MHHGRAVLGEGRGQGLGEALRARTETTGTPNASTSGAEVGLDQVDAGRLAELVALVLPQDPVAAVVDEQELRVQPVLAARRRARRCRS